MIKRLLFLLVLFGCETKHITIDQAGMIPETLEEIDLYIERNQAKLESAQKDLEIAEKKLQLAIDSGSRNLKDEEFNVYCEDIDVKSYTLSIELAKNKKEKLK